MDKKLIYGFLFATAMVGCTNEEFAEKQQAGDFGLDRPVIENFSFAVGQPGTRMEGDDQTSWFTGDDKIGAVLVDYAQQTPYYQVVEGHVGNNKFVYNPSTDKFETVGTTVVGSWLFYASYDERMTTNRNGVKFDFPAVQTYSGTGYQEIAKMDFKTSPIVNLAGQEDGYFNYEIPMTSVYSYARITMKFEEPVIVQKLVIRPTAVDATTSDPFSTVYTIANTMVPQANVYSPGLLGEQGVLNAACDDMRNRTDYQTAKSNFINYLTADDANRDIIALNCLANTTESVDFDARMAIPAGKYNNLAVYAYTNKGVYKYDVNNANVAADDDYNSGAQEEFLLRRQYGVALHNVNGVKVPGQKEYLEMTTTLDYTQLASTEETDGTVVISQEDLIAVINGIDRSQEVKIRVLGDAVKINQEVMTALKAKVADYPGAYLSFKDTDGQIEVIGNTSAGDPLMLQDITFNGGAKLTSGYANVNEDVIIPSNQSFTVNAGTTLTFTTEDGTYTGIINNGNVIFDNNNNNVITVAAIRSNLGTITINTPVKITTTLKNDKDVMAGLTGTIINNSTLDLNGTSTNNGKITNEGIINLTKESTSNGEIVNNKTFNISSTLTNNGTITNNDGAILLVKGDGTSALNNAVAGVITNFGDMYCHEGNNKINNTGKIYAKAGSTTYITTNSQSNETTTVTNSNVMGEIFCDNRNEDVSVTTSTQKGYISYEVQATVNELTKETGDKFNKVYLNGSCKLNHESVNYVVVNAESTITLNSDKNYQEFTFNADATLYSAPAYKNMIGKLVVAEGVRVKVPTENAIGVYEVTYSTTSKTSAVIDNKGTILVGGNFWSSLAQPATGTFASGDGQTTAFHWSQSTWN